MSVQRSFSYTVNITSGASVYTDPFSLQGIGNYSLQSTAQTVVVAGPWDSGTSYNIGDVVEYGGAYYIATIANTGAQPNISADWSLYQCFVNVDFEGTSVELDTKPLDVSFSYIIGQVATPTGQWSMTTNANPFAFKWGRMRLTSQPSPNNAPGICKVTVTLQEV